MITFIGVQCTEKLYFPSRKDGFEFYFEIIEGLYSEKRVVDLEHIQVSYGHVNINSMKEIIRDRLKNYEPVEE